MININIEFALFQNKSKLNMSVEDGSSIEGLLVELQLVDKADTYFYVVNGSIKMKTYRLHEGDCLKIFTVTSGG